MSSDNIYAQLRSWYTGLRSASDPHRHLQNAAVSNTPGGGTEHHLNEAGGPIHTLHHELLASPHIISRPWPAPQQALRNTLSNASLDKDVNRSRPVTREAEETTDQAQEVVDSPSKRSDIANSEHNIKEPATSPSSPRRNMVRTQRATSRSSSVRSDRPDSGTIKSNKLRRRLERGKSTSTVAQATIPTSPSHLVSPISKRRHTGGHIIKPPDVENLLASISSERNKSELTNSVSPPPRQDQKESLFARQRDDEPAEQPQTSKENRKDILTNVKPQDATGSVKQSDPMEHEEHDPSNSQQPRIEEHSQLDELDPRNHEAYKKQPDDHGVSLQPGPDSELSMVQQNDEEAEADIKLEKVETMGNTKLSSQRDESPREQSRMTLSSLHNQASSPDGAAEQTGTSRLQENPLASSQATPSVVTSTKSPAQNFQSNQIKDSGQDHVESRSQTSIGQQPYNLPSSNNRNIIHYGPPVRRTNYLSFVDTRYLYDPPPLGPAGFFPKEAFPNVEPLRVF